MFCRLWKKSSKIVKTCNWWTGSLVGYHFSKMVFHVCHGSYVLCEYPEVCRKYVYCEFILYWGCDLHFSFQFRTVTRNTTRVSEVRGKEFRCSTPRDQFYISKAWFTCHILTLGNVIDNMLWCKSKMPPEDSYVNGILACLWVYRKKWAHKGSGVLWRY